MTKKKIYYRFNELRAIKERKEEMKYSLEYIAEVTGINKNTLVRISRNTNPVVNKDHADRLAKFFDCELDELVIIE